MKNEKIIATIKKVLELSKNNPSEEEAKAAALKAQELLAKILVLLKVIHSPTFESLYIVDSISNRFKEGVEDGKQS